MWSSLCHFMMSVTLILDFVLPKSETEIFDQSLDSSPSSKNYFHFLLQPFKSLSRFILNKSYIIVRSSRSQTIALMTSRSRATKPSTVRGQIRQFGKVRSFWSITMFGYIRMFAYVWVIENSIFHMFSYIRTFK